VTSCDLEPARLPHRANTVVVGNLQLQPRPRDAGRRVPTEVAGMPAGVPTSTLEGTPNAPLASAASTAAVTRWPEGPERD
jgi:hypothetical protein